MGIINKISVDGNEYTRPQAGSDPGKGVSRVGKTGGKSFRSCKLNAVYPLVGAPVSPIVIKAQVSRNKMYL
jgi:hypothetical protein